MNDEPIDAQSDVNAAYTDNHVGGGFTSPNPSLRKQAHRQSMETDQKSTFNDDKYNEKPTNQCLMD